MEFRENEQFEEKEINLNNDNLNYQFDKYIYDLNYLLRKKVKEMYKISKNNQKNNILDKELANLISFFRVELLKIKLLSNKFWYDSIIGVMLGDYYRLNSDVSESELEDILNRIDIDDLALNEIANASILFADLDLYEYQKKMQKKSLKIVTDLNIFEIFEKENFDEFKQIEYLDTIYIENWISFWEENVDLYEDVEEFRTFNDNTFMDYIKYDYDNNYQLFLSYMDTLVKVNKLVVDSKKLDETYQVSDFDKKFDNFLPYYNNDNQLDYPKDNLLDTLIKTEESFLYQMVVNYNMMSYIKHFFDKNILYKYQDKLNKNNIANVKKKTID